MIVDQVVVIVPKPGRWSILLFGLATAFLFAVIDRVWISDTK